MYPRLSLVVSMALFLLPGCIADKDGEDTQDTSEEEVNEAPVAVDDAASVISGQTVEIDLTDNDDDANDRDDFYVIETEQPANGLVEIVSEDDVTYTSLNDYIGIDTFTYKVIDEGGLTDEANVTINVLPVPTLVITAPVQDSTVTGSDVEVTFEVSGCEMSSPSANKSGCHVHQYQDEAELDPLGHYSADSITMTPDNTCHADGVSNGTVCSDVTECDDGLGATWTCDALGTHVITLVLIQNNGSDQPFSPEISDTVTFQVGAAR